MKVTEKQINTFLQQWSNQKTQSIYKHELMIFVRYCNYNVDESKLVTFGCDVRKDYAKKTIKEAIRISRNFIAWLEGRTIQIHSRRRMLGADASEAANATTEINCNAHMSFDEAITALEEKYAELTKENNQMSISWGAETWKNASEKMRLRFQTIKRFASAIEAIKEISMHFDNE